MRMLVVDDEGPILFALRDFFTSLGHEVDCARTTDEADELIEAERYAVVLLDLRLGAGDGSDGLEVARRVRRRDRSTRIIILTAYGSPEAEAEARRAGVDRFLHKPQRLREVATIVQQLVAG